MGIIPFVVRRLGVLVERGSAGFAYPAFVGATAFGFTLSMAIPFGSILAVAVLLAPHRWKSIVLWSSLGSSLGALVLYLGFHHLGWLQIAEAYPDLTESKAWRDATRWVSSYGVYAVFGITALPLPQTPALMFAGIQRLPVAEIWLAVLLGKLVKYGIYAAVVAMFPHRFTRRFWLLLRAAQERAP